MKIVGIDPAIAAGKPIAIVTLELTPTDPPKIIGVVDETSLAGSLWEKYELWHLCLRCVIGQQKPHLVAIEEARGPGGKGSAHLRALVTLLKELCEELGVPVQMVNNQQAKSAALYSGRRTAKRVAEGIRTFVENVDALPQTAGYDYEAAVSIAWAGERLWREKQMSDLVQNEYYPDHITPAGWTLSDKLEELNMSQAELARRMGCHRKTINEITQGKAPITPEIALQLEAVLSIPAGFWNRRELQYRQYRARQAERMAVAEEADEGGMT